MIGSHCLNNATKFILESSSLLYILHSIALPNLQKIHIGNYSFTQCSYLTLYSN